MTTITISERLYTLMVRATKVHWNRLLEHAKEHSSTDEARRDYNNRGLSEQTFYTLKVNEFEFTLPHSKNTVTFRLLTHKDEQDISRELEGLKKINKDSSTELSTRLKYLITSVEGSREKKDIREFVENYFLAKDSRALREYIKEIQPDVDLTFFPDSGSDRTSIPIGVSFFWPDI